MLLRRIAAGVQPSAPAETDFDRIARGATMHSALPKSAEDAVWFGVPGSVAALAAAEAVSDIVVLRTLLASSSASAASLHDRIVGTVNAGLARMYGMLAAGASVALLQRHGELGQLQELIGALAVLGDEDLSTAG